MKVFYIFVLFILTLACFLSAADPENLSEKLVLRLVNEKTWDAGVADPEKVFYSSGGEIWKYFPGRKLPPIEIEAKGGPITLYKRGPEGQIRVLLNVSKTFWAQHAFQFAHEMGHIVCGYRQQENRNLWFEESLCELSSLFVLRRMSETWQTKPPYPNWKSYAPHLKEYAEQRIVKAALPAGTTLAQWYAENSPVLLSNAVDRDRNTVVAAALLPLFEAEPESWEAVTWLNTEHLNKLFTFKDYLAAWRRNCPEKHRPFVTRIARQFELDLP